MIDYKHQQSTNWGIMNNAHIRCYPIHCICTWAIL